MGEGGFHAAPYHEGVCRADRDRFPESYSDGIISILLQERIVNDADDVTAVVVPEFFGKIDCDFFKYFGERYVCHTVILIERIEYRIQVFLFHPPQVHRTGVLPGSGIGKVIDIFQFRGIGFIINQRNPFCPPADIPAHGFAPCIIIRTGGGIRPLGVDHELFVVGVFV
ncbi:MAG: hypothetical protein IKY52_04260 [Clostridia bacterium]|nr:hypothetical protein [Clostridia bacterium]